MDEWNKNYRDELDGLGTTGAGRRALLRSLTAEKKTASGHPRPRRVMRTAVALGLAACVLTAAVGAAVVAAPVLKGYFDGTYDENATALGRSVTQNGWTMTITDLVGDDQYFYIGVDLVAPEGTVLDADNYQLEGMEYLPSRDRHPQGLRAIQLDDGDPADNHLSFVYMDVQFNRFTALISGGAVETPRGEKLELSFNDLYVSSYDPQAKEIKKETICGETWDFGTIKLDYPDNAIKLTPNLPVTTLGVEAVISHVEVTPLSVIVKIEGDALKGHHTWVPKNTVDGWYGCHEFQEVTLYDKDGKAVLPDPDGVDNNGTIAGSGCSGGEPDSDEPGALLLERNYGYLLDLDSLDHLTVCGVEIPLH